MHTALRNGPGFLLQKRGKMLAWPECTGTLFPHTHRLLFLLSCNDFGKHSCVHNSRLLSCPLTLCPSNPVVPGEGAGATILPLKRHDPRGLSFQWQSSAAHLPIRGMDQTALGCCEMGRAQRLGTPLLPFSTIPLFRVFVLEQGVIPSEGVGRAHSA